MDRRRVVWSEPALPKYIKINPNSPPGAAEGLQPGDMSMLKVAEEFLEEPEEGLALPVLARYRTSRPMTARPISMLDPNQAPDLAIC
jgi:hypothetical protein